MTNRRLWMGLAVVVVITFAVMFGRWLSLGQAIPRAEVLLPKLRILAYEAFTGVSGPGPQLVAQFEKTCGCQVEIFSVAEAGLLLEKLRLIQKEVPVDLVIGLDQMRLDQARQESSWLEVKVSDVPWEPPVQDFLEADFVPLDWAPLTFLFRETEIAPPRSPQDLLDSRFAHGISLQDPRTSTPGLQWLFAIHSWVGEDHVANFLERLKPNIQSISPSWAAAYGLFQRHQAKVTFSYLTSLAYHWIVEKDMTYKAAAFAEGHPVQVEYVGLPSTCGECDLAKKFLTHLLAPESQRTLMLTNYMFPVRHGVTAGTPFAELPTLKSLNPEQSREFRSRREKAVATWLKAMQ